MKNLIIIAAIGKHRELGRNNDLVWRIPEDLTYFRNTTMGHYIFMGRKTYESMPKNLLNRRYLVISRELKNGDNVKTFADVDTFLEFAKKTEEDIYIIGGGQVYSMLLPCVDKMVLTEIDAEEPNADVFFPRFDKDEWESEKIFKGTTEDGIVYRRRVYTRK